MGTPVSKQGSEENHTFLVNKIKCEFGDTLMGAQNNGNTECKGNVSMISTKYTRTYLNICFYLWICFSLMIQMFKNKYVLSESH